MEVVEEGRLRVKVTQEIENFGRSCGTYGRGRGMWMMMMMMMMMMMY